jgi:hypothetical protein
VCEEGIRKQCGPPAEAAGLDSGRKEKSVVMAGHHHW